MRPLLLVEDDPAIAALLADALAEEGYAVEGAATPAAARALLAARGPTAYALVLTDAVATSTRDLYTWIDELRVLTAAPLVVSSAWPASAFGDYEAHGVAALLPKPFDLDDLLKVLTPLVDRVDVVDDGPLEQNREHLKQGP